MPITVVFDPPLPSDSPITFNTKAFTLLGDLNDWSTEANALPAELAVDLVAERSATATLTNKTLTSPDINGGTIDGTVIGGSSAAAGSFTTLSASGANEAVTSYGVSPLCLYCTTAFGIDVGPSLGFYGKADGGAATQFGSISARKENATSGNTAGYLSFATRVYGSTPTEKMRISSTGAVTIPGSLSAGALTVASTSTGGFSVVDLTTNGNDWEIGAGGSTSSKANSFYIQDITSAAFRFVIDQNGASTFNSGTFGYGTGAGGTVTQATSKSTAVTLNKPSGQITMNNAALAAGATVFFYLNNSTFANGDLLILSPLWGTADYQVWPGTVYGGTSLIAVKNISAGSLSDALVVRFAVIKGAAS